MQARAISEIARLNAGLPRATAIEVAKDMGELMGEPVGDRDVGKWLRGESVPGTLARLWAFAKVLHVDPGWLAFGTESNASPPSLLDALPPAPLTPVTRKRGAKQR